MISRINFKNITEKTIFFFHNLKSAEFQQIKFQRYKNKTGGIIVIIPLLLPASNSIYPSQ
jgi:hypothetical protein